MNLRAGETKRIVFDVVENVHIHWCRENQLCGNEELVEVFFFKKIFLDDSSYSITFKSFVALFSKCQCLSTSAAVLGIYKFEKNRM